MGSAVLIKEIKWASLVTSQADNIDCQGLTWRRVKILARTYSTSIIRANTEKTQIEGHSAKYMISSSPKCESNNSQGIAVGE